MSDKPVVTAKKQLPKEMEKFQFVKGTSGNPNGRPKGARCKLSEEFINLLLTDFKEHGLEAVEKCRKEDTSTYIRVIASIVPKELTINEGETAIERILDSVSDGDLADFVTGVRLLTAATVSGEAGKEKGIKDRFN